MKKYLIPLLILLSSPVFAWETVGEGIEYREYTLPGPNNVFVSRMYRHNPNAGMTIMTANDRRKGNQTIGDQLDLYDGKVLFDGKDWGKRLKPVVGVNGDFYLGGGASRTLRVADGYMAYPMLDDQSIWGGFYATFGGDMFISGSAVRSSSVTLICPSGKSFDISAVNSDLPENGAAIYNYKYGLSAPAADTVAVIDPGGPWLVGTTSGDVVSLGKGEEETVIPFDRCVVAANGDIAKELAENLKTGTKVKIKTVIKAKLNDIDIPEEKFAGLSESLIGSQIVLQDGGVIANEGIELMTDRHPRTVLAYNDDYLYFMVCDGRRKGVSIGMTGVELGEFCRDELNADFAVNMDGGGSSTMITNGTLRNKPSDGKQRAVANGFVMYNTLPEERSDAFLPCQKVEVKDDEYNIRTGPGKSYPVITTVNKGAIGRVTPHKLCGIKAGNHYWSQVNFYYNVTGWITEDALIGGDPDNEPPTDPGNFRKTESGKIYVVYAWEASEDDYGVSHYNIYKNGVLSRTTKRTSFVGITTDGDVYSVSAVDYAGNESNKVK
ncbi:MAG: phosphodiester glycosidase family protein [Abditibacteriota bacterium]|nr:phosphodiester glycosidase family protein [Abditibacteriota bacterium]